MYIKITDQPIKAEEIIDQAKCDSSGCVVTYVGLIGNASNDQPVLSAEYKDTAGKAEDRLRKLAEEIQQHFPVNGLAMCQRAGRLKVGEVNLVFAFACGHRQEGFAACSYAIERLK
jgi:molybdopterin synthase catalytic subunit